jgi:hypothetical protein
VVGVELPRGPVVDRLAQSLRGRSTADCGFGPSDIITHEKLGSA